MWRKIGFSVLSCGLREKVKKGSEIPTNQEINLLKMQQSIEKSSEILKNRVIYLLKLL